MRLSVLKALVAGSPRMVEGQRDRQRERRYQERYAKRHGYYWLPCPVCGEFCGGHEASGFLPPTGAGCAEGICPACTAERQQVTEERLRALSEDWGFQIARWGFPGVVHHTPSGGRITDNFEITVS